jgi:hypothetical protein
MGALAASDQIGSTLILPVKERAPSKSGNKFRFIAQLNG